MPAKKTAQKQKGIRPFTLVLIVALVLIAALIAVLTLRNQRPTSIDDTEGLGKIWTSTESAACKDASRMFSILLDAAGYFVKDQPENVKAAMEFRAKTQGITWSAAFDELFADKIVAGTYLSWVSEYPDKQVSDLKDCLQTGPIFVWQFEQP